MDLIKIGQLIAEKRKEKNLTQAQLGELLCISGKSVSKWERGINMPDIEKMNQLCSILNVELVDMLNGEVNGIDSNNVFRFNLLKKLKNSKLNCMFVILLILIVIVFLFSVTFTITNYNKNVIYSVSSVDSDLSVNGFLIFNQEENYFIINDLSYQSELTGTLDEPSVTQILVSVNYEDSILFTYVEDYEKPVLLSEKLDEISFSILDNKVDKTNILDYDTDFSDFKLIVYYVTMNGEQKSVEADLNFKKIFSNNKLFY